MAKETKTVQCYPDDSKINKMIAQYAAFGWELIGNQRCREEGSYVISTFHKLTFSREKNVPWYGEVVELEDRYNACMAREPINYADDPSKGWLFYGIVGIVLGALVFLAVGSMAGFFEIFTLVPSLVFMGIGAILLAIYIIKKKKSNSDYSAYLRLKGEWEKTAKKEADEILQQAEAIVNAN